MEGEREKIKRERPKSKDFSVLNRLLKGTEDPDVKREYEAERRYKASDEKSERPSREQLEAIPGAYTRRIEQAYVTVALDDGTKERLRLRVTTEPGKAPKLRIARKTSPEIGTAKKDRESLGEWEDQLVFDESKEPEAADFYQLWRLRDSGHVIHKMRYYVPFALPNGNTAEVHYDMHEGPPFPMDGYHRIEVELHGKKGDKTGESVEDDAEWLGSAEGYAYLQGLFPWIGRDVTGVEGYGSRALYKHGSLEAALQAAAEKAEKKKGKGDA